MLENKKNFWCDYLLNASNICNIKNSEHVELYLLYILESSVSNIDLADNNYIIDCLNLKDDKLKKTADNCLIISGMFPERCFYLGAGELEPLVWAGQQSYLTLYENKGFEVYSDLSEDFIRYMDLILVVRYMFTKSIIDKELLKSMRKINSMYPKYQEQLYYN